MRGLGRALARRYGPCHMVSAPGGGEVVWHPYMGVDIASHKKGLLKTSASGAEEKDTQPRSPILFRAFLEPLWASR